MRMRRLLVWSALTSSACLPDDTRPPPARIVVTASPDAALVDGLDTDDGWRIAFEGFLVSLGELELDGDDCVPYAETDYLRVLDMTRPEPQTLSTLHALGSCRLGFRVQVPAADSVLGAGVTAGERTFLRTPASDPFVTARGAALHVAGSATRGTERVDFDWSFRRDLEYPSCATLAFESGDDATAGVEIRGATLFRPAPDAPELVFDPYATADADGNGHLSLEELAGTELGARLYLELAPAVAGLRDGAPCRARELEDD